MKKKGSSKKKNFNDYFSHINLILLGLLMIIPGLSKLFIAGPNSVSAYLASLGFPLPQFFVWILILLEIGSGVAILARWKLDIVKYIPAVILLIAIFTTHMGDIQAIVIRLALISSYLLLQKNN